MSNEYGLTADDINSLIQDMNSVRREGYIHYSVLTLCVYDFFCRLSREIKYIHSPKKQHSWSRTMIHTVYNSIGLLTVCFILLAQYIHLNRLSIKACFISNFMSLTILELLLTGAIKTLLVSRLRALWNNNYPVTIVLILAVILEISAGAGAVVIGGIYGIKYSVSVPLLHGCYLAGPQAAFLSYVYYAIALRGIRVFTTSIELALTLIKLFHVLRDIKTGDTVRANVMHIRKVTPVIYVFYRDGTLYFIPIFIVNTISLLEAASVLNSSLATLSWDIWLAALFYLCGTRLILNLRETNCKLTEGSVAQKLTSIRFGGNSGDSRGNNDTQFGQPDEYNENHQNSDEENMTGAIVGNHNTALHESEGDIEEVVR